MTTTAPERVRDAPSAGALLADPQVTPDSITAHLKAIADIDQRVQTAVEIIDAADEIAHPERHKRDLAILKLLRPFTEITHDYKPVEDPLRVARGDWDVLGVPVRGTSLVTSPDGGRKQVPGPVVTGTYAGRADGHPLIDVGGRVVPAVRNSVKRSDHIDPEIAAAAEAELKLVRARKNRDIKNAYAEAGAAQVWKPAAVSQHVGVSRSLVVDRIRGREPVTLPGWSIPDAEQIAPAAARAVRRMEDLRAAAQAVRNKDIDFLLSSPADGGLARSNAEVARMAKRTTARISQRRTGGR